MKNSPFITLCLVVAMIVSWSATVASADENVESFRVIGQCSKYFKGMRQVQELPRGVSRKTCRAVVTLAHAGTVGIYARSRGRSNGWVDMVGRATIPYSLVPYRVSFTLNRRKSVRLEVKSWRVEIIVIDPPFPPEPPLPISCNTAWGQINVELSKIQACAQDSDCGQVLQPGCNEFSGIVVRKDADPSEYYKAGSRWIDNKCEGILADVYPPFLHCDTTSTEKKFKCERNVCRWDNKF